MKPRDVTPPASVKFRGWFISVDEANISIKSFTFVRLQFKGELKLEFRNIARREALGKNTGWLLGGADTLRFLQPWKTPSEVLSIKKPFPQLAMSTSLLVSPCPLKAKLEMFPRMDTLCKPAVP